MKYRAAYIPANLGSNGVGVVLTGPEHADLPDAELLAIAEIEAEIVEAIGSIEIGEWNE